MDGFSSYHNNGNVNEHDFNKLTQIGLSIQKISQNVSSMQRMVQQLGSSQDSQELRKQLEQIQQYTQQLVKDTSANLIECNSTPPDLIQREQKQFRMQWERLAEHFTSTLNAFQTVQRNAGHKVKEQMMHNKALVMGVTLEGPHKKDQLIELQENSVDRQQAQMQKEINLQLLEEQEQSIRRLENDIVDVNQIFKELSILVHDQGDMVDSIEASIEMADTLTSCGTQHLQQASSYKSNVRKKKFIMAAILALILTVIIIIIACNKS